MTTTAAKWTKYSRVYVRNAGSPPAHSEGYTPFDGIEDEPLESFSDIDILRETSRMLNSDAKG